MRTTRKQVEAVFELFCSAFGRRVATAYNDIGAWTLDYSPYGGYVINEPISEGGGVTQPFGAMRRSPREMVDVMHFALRARDALVVG